MSFSVAGIIPWNESIIAPVLYNLPRPLADPKPLNMNLILIPVIVFAVALILSVLALLVKLFLQYQYMILFVILKLSVIQVFCNFIPSQVNLAEFSKYYDYFDILL